MSDIELSDDKMESSLDEDDEEEDEDDEEEDEDDEEEDEDDEEEDEDEEADMPPVWTSDAPNATCSARQSSRSTVSGEHPLCWDAACVTRKQG